MNNVQRASAAIPRLVALSTAFFLSQAAALDLRPDGVFAYVGNAEQSTAAAGLGLLWDWDWKRERSVLLTAHTEVQVAAWRTEDFDGGTQDYWHLTVLPFLRVRPAAGKSPFFFDAGIGASYMNRIYQTPNKSFSTKWNFYDMLGVGYSFGSRFHNEIALRYVHLSNGGYRKPNPGENFVQVRYAHRF
jgi:lipid A 3-O-deacylase